MKCSKFSLGSYCELRTGLHARAAGCSYRCAPMCVVCPWMSRSRKRCADEELMDRKNLQRSAYRSNGYVGRENGAPQHTACKPVMQPAIADTDGQYTNVYAAPLRATPAGCLALASWTRLPNGMTQHAAISVHAAIKACHPDRTRGSRGGCKLSIVCMLTAQWLCILLSKHHHEHYTASHSLFLVAGAREIDQASALGRERPMYTALRPSRAGPLAMVSPRGRAWPS